MPRPFDRALIGRSFGGVIDDTARGWIGSLGFTEDGPQTGVADFQYPDRQSEETAKRQRAEVQQRFAPVRAALRDGVVALVDIDGNIVPKAVWFTAGWAFYRDDRRGVEWLEVATATGRKIAYFSPRFVAPAAFAPAPTTFHLIEIPD